MQTFTQDSCNMVDNSAFNAPAGGSSNRSNSSSSSSSQRRTNNHGRQLLLLILLIGWGCKSASCADGDAHSLLQGTHKLCGQALNDAMDIVCAKGYNTISKKRMDVSEAESEMGLGLGLGLETEQLQLQTHAGYALSPLLSSIYGREVLIKTRRLRRQNGGIHDECCRNSCSYNELYAYCRQK